MYNGWMHPAITKCLMNTPMEEESTPTIVMWRNLKILSLGVSRIPWIILLATEQTGGVVQNTIWKVNLM